MPENPQPAKRGRKRKNKNYFAQREEDAVVMFLTGETKSYRNKVYNEFLYDPINKMIESIIRKYKLYRKDMAFEDIHADTLSFLITKFHKFKPEKGKKAYSYFGTICKHYLIGQLMKDDKHMKNNISYEDIYLSIEGDEKYSYNIDDDDTGIPVLIETISDEIQNIMDEQDLNENEIKVGHAIVRILTEWDEIFHTGKGNNKYNKNLVLSCIREMTNLTTKEIRNSMKKYRKIYYLMKDEHIEKGML